MCYDGTYQNCTVEGGTCTDVKDDVLCCGNLICFNETCQPCTVENATCGDDFVDCRTDLTCYDGTCQDFTGFNDTRSANAISCCCGTLIIILATSSGLNLKKKGRAKAKWGRNYITSANGNRMVKKMLSC